MKVMNTKSKTNSCVMVFELSFCLKMSEVLELHYIHLHQYN
jgi:hypothetical protein